MKINMFNAIAAHMNELFESVRNFLKEHKKESPEQQLLTKQFNEFLSVGDTLFCYKMIDEGYTPKKSLKNNLDRVMSNQIEKGFYRQYQLESMQSIPPILKIKNIIQDMDISTHHYDFFNIYTNGTYSHTQNDILKIFKDKNKIQALHEYMNNTLDNIEYKYTSEDYLDREKYGTNMFSHIKNEEEIKHNNCVMYIAAILIKNNLFSHEEIQDIADNIKYVNNLIIESNDSAPKHAGNTLEQSYISSYTDSLERFLSQKLSDNNHKENVIRQIKSFKARQSTFKEQISHLVVHEDYSIEDLPLPAKNKIENIEQIVIKLNNEEVDNFVEERLPVILKKYFNIDEEYRTKLKSVEGFNAEELMMQSLDNIERIVKAKQEDNNYDLLSELSVENRKLKAKV